MEDSGAFIAPGDVLKRARVAARSCDYAAAAHYYERFFDRALIDQGKAHNYYRFVAYHRARPALADSAVHFVWDRLVDEGLWEICASHPGKPIERYQDAWMRFDAAMAAGMGNPDLGGTAYYDSVKEWYVREVSDLVLVLRKTGRQPTAATLLEQASADLRSRGLPDLMEEIKSRAER